MAAPVILDQYGRPFRREPRTARDLFAERYAALKAKYDAAQTTDENRRHWSEADGLSAAAANSAGVRDTLRRRSRYEYDNGGYCQRIHRGLANDLVGTGPTLQILSDDDSLSERIEQAFARWAGAARLPQKFHTMAQAKSREGEAFAYFFTNAGLKHPDGTPSPVQLDLSLVEADRVADPSGFQTNFIGPPPGVLDGIEYDGQGNPVAYHVLRHHPGDTWGVMPMEADRYEAKYVLHWFRCDRAGQLRGVPELTAALPLFPYLRRWTLATIAAAETAANFAAMLETEASPDAETTEPTPFETLEIVRNMMTTLPAGTKLHQLAAEHPNTQHREFKREVLKECGAPVGMPVNVVTGDSSDHNFSSAKLDHYGYRGDLRVTRYFAGCDLMERVFALFVEEAVLVPGVLPDGMSREEILALPRAWYWPGWPSMDKEQNDAKGDTERLNNGTATLSEINAEWGQDWKAVLRQRGRELAYGAGQGVPPPPSGGGAGGAPAGGAGGASSSPAPASRNGAPEPSGNGNGYAARLAAAFCPTGEGGGVDPSCPSGPGGGDSDKGGGDHAAARPTRTADEARAALSKDAGKSNAVKPPFPVDEDPPYQGSASITAADRDAAPVVAVPAADLVATQSTVVASSVARKIDSYDPGDDAQAPVVVRAGGKMYLDDGTHQASAAVYRGAKSVRVRMFDYSPGAAKPVPAKAAKAGA